MVKHRRIWSAVGAIAGILAMLVLITPTALAAPPGGVIDRQMNPPIHVRNGQTATYKDGYQPLQIWHAYGIDQLLETGDNGTGQTIALVEAYGSPNLQNDLDAFDTQFGLPAITKLPIQYPQGQPSSTNSGWALETSLDVEWAHALAPQAKILVVVARNSNTNNLLAAVDYASKYANVVSMSWGGSEFYGETSYDNHFSHAGVVYTASSGDSGSGVEWPAVSPNVVGVGGTSLYLDGNDNVTSETAWSGSGGGISAYEPQPSYQDIFQSSGNRGVPDVAFDADPYTGVAVYDSVRSHGTPWYEVGGTSVGAPCWAAIFALADQNSPLTDGHDALYQLATPSAYATNYTDITSGSNGGYTAGKGYDFVTGLGTPRANNLVPGLSPQTTTNGSLHFSPASGTLTAGQPSGEMTVDLSVPASTGGLPVNLTTSSATGGFSTSSSGPWALTLTVTVAAGHTASEQFYYSDNTAGSATLTASASGWTSAIQTYAVDPAALATITVSPASASVPEGGSQVFTASGTDQYGNPVSIDPSWTTALGTLSTNSGSNTSITFTAGGSSGSGNVTATQGSVSGNAAVTVLALESMSVKVAAGTTVQKGPNYRTPLTVTATNGSVAGISGASVTLNVYTYTGSSPSANPVASGTGTTDSNGQLTLTFKTRTSGSYYAEASVGASGYITTSGNTTFNVK